MVFNRQSSIRVPLADLDRFLRRVARKLSVRPGAFTVCLVTNVQMARWNRDFRKKTGATDVLSFPADDAPAASKRAFERPARLPAVRKGDRSRGKNRFSFTSASSTSYLGDIAIAPAVARKNARCFGRSLHDELCILILHGAIHLLGYDHETDRGQMDRLEQRLRRSLELA
jgi:probable rRNA maturation factor